MKKLFKFLVFTVFFFSLLSLIFGLFLATSTLGPALKGSDVSFIDLLRNKVDEEDYEKVKQLVLEKSSLFGKDAAESFICGLKILLPSSPSVEQEEGSENSELTIDEILQKSEQAANKGVKEGMEFLSDVDRANKALLKEAIENMEKD